MSYQLEYNLQSVKITNNPTRKKRARFVVLLLALVVGTIAAHIMGTLFHAAILKPGESAQAAANEMAESLRSGTSLEDAIETFYITLSE